MKTVILAGGFGTRISEETGVRPKPMVEIGGRPILWHIMRICSHHGLNEFVICCGHKGEVIKRYFADYYLSSSDVTFDVQANVMHVHRTTAEPWKVTLIDTGESTMTGGRLKRVRDHVGDATFCMTYGDGVSDIDIPKLIAFHRSTKALATLTAVQSPGRFGAFQLGQDDFKVQHFREKPRGDGAWINGGFFILEPRVMDYIAGDATTWEREPMERLSAEGQLAAYRHDGFWQPMDSLRDKNVLEDLWRNGKPPWKVW